MFRSLLLWLLFLFIYLFSLNVNSGIKQLHIVKRLELPASEFTCTLLDLNQCMVTLMFCLGPEDSGPLFNSSKDLNFYHRDIS